MFIESCCSERPELAHELRRLLDNHPGSEPTSAIDDATPDGPSTLSTDTVPVIEADEILLRSIGPYEVESLVGRGGMGNVFRATDTRLDRQVALKIPRIDVVGNPRLRQRFVREARIAAQLDHPGLVEIYEYGVSQSVCYVATRWCSGGDLANWISRQRDPCDPMTVAKFMQKLSRAVQHCHESGILHLDIKPGNIMLENPSNDEQAIGEPLLSDFGLARVVEQSWAETHTSRFMGTPLYMSPEQAECRSEDLGRHTDVFALGVVMYELLYQSRPFDGTSTVDLMDHIRSGRVDPIQLEKTTPRALRSIWRTCLQRRPEDRYGDAGELANDLQRFIEQKPIQRHPPSLAKRFGYWMMNQERIRQAGITLLAIQIPGVASLFICGGLLMLGLSPVTGDIVEYFTQVLMIFFTINVASLLTGRAAIHLRWWSVPIGLLFSLLYFFTAGLMLIGWMPALVIYDNAPKASFIGHLVHTTFAAAQVVAFAIAIPAAIVRRKRESTGSG